jgi:hypothetical protein
MDDYNHLISSHILDNYENMVHTAPQPTMFGGKRVRKYVLPASTEYDYPSSLAVGNPNMEDVGGEFWKDFTGMKGKGGKRGMKGGDAVRDVVGEIGSVLNPVNAIKLFGLGRGKKGMKGGFDISNPLLWGYDLGHDVIGPALFGKGKGRPKKSHAKGAGFFDSIKSVGKAVGRELAPVAKEVAVDLAKDYIKSKASGSKGGVMLRNDMSQFHSNVYPPALASYHARAGKRATLPKSGAKRNSARGAIVAEIMRKKGLTLPQASKYVKEHNLY